MTPISLISLAACLVAASLAAAVFVRGPGERSNRLMAAMLACAAHWSFCETVWNNLDDPVWVIRTIRLSGFGWFFLGPLVLHMVLEVQDDARSWARKALPGAYVFAAASALLYLTTDLGLARAVPTDWGWSYELGPLFPLVCGPAVFWAVLGVVRWHKLLNPAASALERRQARLGISAIAFTIVAALVTDVLLPALEIRGPRLGSASIVLFAGILAQGLARHDYFVLTPNALAERILGALPDGAALLGTGGEIAVANDALARLVGLPAEALAGVSLRTFLPELSDGSGLELRGLDLGLLDASGRQIPVSVSSSVLRDRSDSPIGRVFAIRDMRETRAMRNRLVTTGRLAAMGELAAGVVHEVNNPIAFMKANLFELRRLWGRFEGSVGEDEPALAGVVGEGSEVIEESLEGVERISRLVESVRSFSHAGLGERELADVNELVQSAAHVAEPKLKYRGARLEQSYAEIPPVLCAPQELRQLFLNLLLNAANAVGRDGVIYVHTDGDADQVRVHVYDDGGGMSPDAVERLFDPVFAPDLPSGGLGIGLPACYEIVRKHGGELEVESQEGHGTRFTIELPAAPPEA